MSENENAVVELKEQSSAVLSWAQTIVVETKIDADSAMVRLSELKGIRQKWCAYWKPLKDAAKAAHSAICGKENEGTELIDKAEVLVKSKVLAWQQAERAKAEEAQRKAQAAADEAARREREKAEAAARLQREKEQAALQAVEDARRRAQAATNEAERAKAAAEAEKAQAAANKASAAAAVREETASLVTAPIITVQAQVVTAAGTGNRKTYKADVVDMAALIAAAVPGSVAASFLVFDQKAADAFARATKGKTPVVGVRFREVESLSVRI